MLTAGFMCAPEIGPSMAISTNRIAPVASVLPSRATASLPWLRFCAMIPEPITVAKRKKEPTPSAARRRTRGGSGDILVGTSANLAQLRLQAHRVDAVQRERQEQADTPLQGIIGVAEGSGLLLGGSSDRVGNAPVR